MNKDAIIMDWLTNPANRERLQTLEVSKEVFEFVRCTATMHDFPTKKNEPFDTVYNFGSSYFRLKLSTP